MFIRLWSALEPQSDSIYRPSLLSLAVQFAEGETFAVVPLNLIVLVHSHITQRGDAPSTMTSLAWNAVFGLKNKVSTQFFGLALL